MRATIEQFLPSLEQVKKIRSTLKTVKDEWLETKPGKGNNKYIGVNTVRQILEHATDGVTYWDFGTTKEWREEVYKYNKDNNSWQFDGYVYHVKGYLFIPGLGQREQYGCKVAIGGKDNQDSAYKSATSNALVKCASLFGVGEDLYSKIKIDTGDDDQYYGMQQDPGYALNNNQGNYPHQNPPQFYPDQQQQQQHVWGNNQSSQTYFNPQQWVQTDNQPQQQQQQYVPEQQWHQQQQQQNFNQQPADPFQHVQPLNLPDNVYPFNPHEPGTPQAQQWDQQNMPQAQEQSFSAQPSGQAQPNNFQPQEQKPQSVGAPVGAPQPPEPHVSAIPHTWDPNEMQRIHMHKARLNIKTDDQFVPYLRDYFKKEQASLQDITPETLKGLNDYLEKIAV